MRKILSLILILVMLFALCACFVSCGADSEEKDDSEHMDVDEQNSDEFESDATVETKVKDVGEYMDFGAKYTYEIERDDIAQGATYGGQYKTKQTFIFYSNGTGEYRYYYKGRYISSNDIEPEAFSVESYTTEFEWRVASNGAVYAFEKETTYNDDDTRTNPSDTSLPTKPIYFSDEFMVYQLSDAGASRYLIKEGSRLEKILDEVE